MDYFTDGLYMGGLYLGFYTILRNVLDKEEER